MLKSAKTGLNSFVLRSDLIWELTRLLCKRARASDTRGFFRQKLTGGFPFFPKKIVVVLGVEPGMLTPHSLRRGGPIDDFMRSGGTHGGHCCQGTLGVREDGSPVHPAKEDADLGQVQSEPR